MTSREKVKRIFDRAGSAEGAFWTGHPNDKTIPIYAKEWGIAPEREAIYTHLNDDCRWIGVHCSWKDAANCDFSQVYAEIDKHRDKMILLACGARFSTMSRIISAWKITSS